MTVFNARRRAHGRRPRPIVVLILLLTACTSNSNDRPTVVPTTPPATPSQVVETPAEPVGVREGPLPPGPVVDASDL